MMVMQKYLNHFQGSMYSLQAIPDLKVMALAFLLHEVGAKVTGYALAPYSDPNLLI